MPSFHASCWVHCSFPATHKAFVMRMGKRVKCMHGYRCWGINSFARVINVLILHFWIPLFCSELFGLLFLELDDSVSFRISGVLVSNAFFNTSACKLVLQQRQVVKRGGFSASSSSFWLVCFHVSGIFCVILFWFSTHIFVFLSCLFHVLIHSRLPFVEFECSSGSSLLHEKESHETVVAFFSSLNTGTFEGGLFEDFLLLFPFFFRTILMWIFFSENRVSEFGNLNSRQLTRIRFWLMLNFLFSRFWFVRRMDLYSSWCWN